MEDEGHRRRPGTLANVHVRTIRRGADTDEHEDEDEDEDAGKRRTSERERFMADIYFSPTLGVHNTCTEKKVSGTRLLKSAGLATTTRNPKPLSKKRGIPVGPHVHTVGDPSGVFQNLGEDFS